MSMGTGHCKSMPGYSWWYKLQCSGVTWIKGGTRVRIAVVNLCTHVLVLPITSRSKTNVAIDIDKYIKNLTSSMDENEGNNVKI